MGLQYSAGTLINRTFTPATRSDWVNNVSQAVSDAGWTAISGTPGVSADVKMETAAGNQSQKMRYRFFDPGSGTSAQVTMKNVSESLTSQICYADPASTWRVIANKFHFFVFKTGSANRTAARSFVCGGIFYVPSFLTLSPDAGWLSAIGTTDTEGTLRDSWRTNLRQNTVTNPPGRNSAIYNGTLVDNSGTATNNPAIACWQANAGSASTQGYRWEDNTLPVYEPLIGWWTGSASGNECKLKGQLYDAAVINGSYASETSFTLDSHTWLGITDAASPNIAADATLFLAVA